MDLPSYSVSRVYSTNATKVGHVDALYSVAVGGTYIVASICVCWVSKYGVGGVCTVTEIGVGWTTKYELGGANSRQYVARPSGKEEHSCCERITMKLLDMMHIKSCTRNSVSRQMNRQSHEVYKASQNRLSGKRTQSCKYIAHF